VGENFFFVFFLREREVWGEGGREEGKTPPPPPRAILK